MKLPKAIPAVDESMLTGESVPVDKTAKSNLYAGTVNLNGRLVMRVTATGESTALANIIAAVQRAQNSAAQNIQRLGDQVSNVFVPVIITAAAGADLWWAFAPDSAMARPSLVGTIFLTAHPPAASAAAFIIAAAVLIVACPCAMGAGNARCDHALARMPPPGAAF